MSEGTRTGLAWGGVLLLVQLLLAGVIVPGLSEYDEQGRHAETDSVLGGVGLIVVGVAVIAVVIGTSCRTRIPARRH